MMHMTFYWSKEVTLLIDAWKTTTWTSYLLTLLACLIVPAFYQYLENLRVRLRLAASSAGKTAASDPIETPLLRGKIAGGGGKLVKLAGAVIFAVNSAIGYLLMLAVMSYNGGVFIAIVLGLAIGYVFFRSSDEDAASAVAVDNPCACA